MPKLEGADVKNSAKAEVTILIPNLNGAEFLERAIQSSLKQGGNIKILIVDNGSNDRSREILDFYSHNEENVSFLIEEQRGISHALNKGIRAISTPYIARLDADDEMLPNRIVRQLAFLQENAEHVLVGSQLQFMDKNGSCISSSIYPTSSDEVRLALAYMNPIAHPSVMFRRDAVEKVGLYNSEFDGAEDLELWIRLIEVGKIANINESLTRYRLHSEQVSVTNNLYLVELRVRFGTISSIMYSKHLSLLWKLLYLLRIADLLLLSNSISKAIYSASFRKILKWFSRLNV
jgi:glycosyltransferase involved in cell wall biosynthesis